MYLFLKVNLIYIRTGIWGDLTFIKTARFIYIYIYMIFTVISYWEILKL